MQEVFQVLSFGIRGPEVSLQLCIFIVELMGALKKIGPAFYLRYFPRPDAPYSKRPGPHNSLQRSRNLMPFET